MVTDSAFQSLKSEYNLVVIGGGGAGLSAALTAAENRVAKILILEKRSTLGGNTARATGLFACESPAQARDKIVADKDELFKQAMNWAHWSRINPLIFRAFLNKSGDTIRWLEKKGLEFNVIAFFPNQNPRVEHVAKGKGAYVTKVLAEQCQAAGVEIISNCAGIKLLFDEKHNIAGVTAETGNERVDIKAKSVIIATGGFAGNNAMLKERCPQYYDNMPVRGLPLMGDGVQMAAESGVATDNLVPLLKEGPRVDGHSWPLGGMEREPITVWVNKFGNRFTDESIGDHPFESVNSVLSQSGKVSYSLVDSIIKHKISEKVSGLDSALQNELTKERVKIADSWAEIALWIGVEPAVLQATIDAYNGFCNKGYDADFAKERRYLIPLQVPPFYAVRGLPYLLDTLGGIKVNECMKALNVSHETIPGLFAAGVTTSGWESDTYCSDLSGSAFGYAINSGRIAGESVAQFIYK